MRVARREHDAFAGRARELRIAGSLFTDEPPASVLLVHGPGGIGKSVLLREIGRRGAQAGWTPFAVDARDLAPVPDALEQALAGACTTGWG
jgi:ABC-type transporter Mla maintaining outer membrane lipid asymmetry ATPase subunit MlaF